MNLFGAGATVIEIKKTSAETIKKILEDEISAIENGWQMFTDELLEQISVEAESVREAIGRVLALVVKSRITEEDEKLVEALASIDGVVIYLPDGNLNLLYE